MRHLYFGLFKLAQLQGLNLQSCFLITSGHCLHGSLVFAVSEDIFPFLHILLSEPLFARKVSCLTKNPRLMVMPVGQPSSKEICRL